MMAKINSSWTIPEELTKRRRRDVKITKIFLEKSGDIFEAFKSTRVIGERKIVKRVCFCCVCSLWDEHFDRLTLFIRYFYTKRSDYLELSVAV